MKKNERAKPKIDTKKIIPIILAAILALILVFGVVLGVITMVREMTAVVSYNGITINKGVASYLAASFKHTYLRYLAQSGVNAYDGRAFWISESEDGRTYGELFKTECETYIRNVAVGAYLFERNAVISPVARKWIDENVREVLDFKAGGSEKKFNEEAAKMGFTYADFVTATELLYKAENAMASIYGVDGSVLASSSNISVCEEFLKEYAHVKLLFIRTDDKFVLDENGNRVTEGGRDKLEELSLDEKAERRNDIADISLAIDNVASGGDGQMSSVYFNSFYKKYNDDPQHSASGYYLSPYSEYTTVFADMYLDVVERSLKLEVGGYDKATVDEDGDGDIDAYIFISREAVTPFAYTSSTYEEFFEDFYVDAAAYHYERESATLSTDVNVKPDYYDIDVVALPANTKFKIN